MTPRIGDHAVIGDGRSAALVTRDGTVDWLCWPRFDAPPLFAALLDPERGGHWRLAPSESARVERRYVPGTNVLEARFRCATGTVLVTDLLPVHTREDARRWLVPERELQRVVTCEDGFVDVELELAPRTDWGRAPVALRSAGPGDARADLGRGRLVFRSTVPLTVRDGVARARARLGPGETWACSLSLACRSPAVLVPLESWCDGARERTLAWWRAWSERAQYVGPYREEVVRSALALRLLVFPPSGAIVAAPTTSLPEQVGGSLNWDYRYCWLRDAALTARALFGLGYQGEARAFVAWLLHSTRLTRPALRALYDLFGRRPPRERTLDHLAGFHGSRPVRSGTAPGTSSSSTCTAR